MNSIQDLEERIRILENKLNLAFIEINKLKYHNKIPNIGDPFVFPPTVGPPTFQFKK